MAEKLARGQRLIQVVKILEKSNTLERGLSWRDKDDSSIVPIKKESKTLPNCINNHQWVFRVRNLNQLTLRVSSHHLRQSTRHLDYYLPPFS